MGACAILIEILAFPWPVAAGAVVPEGREFPPLSLIVGIPAKRVGDITDEQAADIERGASEYVERAAAHRASLGKSR